jgi:hypothetical protein
VGSPDLLRAELLLAAGVSAEQEQELVKAFHAIGVTARTRTIPTRRGGEQLPWLVLAALPLQAFLSGLGSKLAEGTYEGLKRLVARLPRHQSAAQSTQVLVLEDPDSRLQIVLEPDLPTDAYRQLVTLDLSAIQQGQLRYDRNRAMWRSER